jgi:hypothetical protein
MPLLLVVFQGLYRVSGSKVKVDAFYSAVVDKQKHINFDDEKIETVSGALKYAIQQLPDPIIPTSQFINFLEISSMLMSVIAS